MTKTRIVRIVTPSLVILAIVSGAFGQLTYGGLCSLDVLRISVTDPLGFLLRYLDLWRASVTFTCPLGFLERSVAAREWLSLWPSVVLVVLSVILLGRVFCAWVCPAGLVRRVFRGPVERRSTREAAPKETIWASYSSYAVLGGMLFASFVFRFPVFCFFCPIGLFFGSLLAVIRLFSSDPLSLELLVLPVLFALELWVLKSWCRSICPLGALLSIVGNLNHWLVPVVSKDKCLTSKGIHCGACARVCPEGIDLAKSTRFSPNSCTKCLECSDKCPVKAIKFPLWAK
jgi:ferredoxin-type protein NapH